MEMRINLIIHEASDTVADLVMYILIPDSRFRIPDSGFQIPDSRFRIPDSGFQTSPRITDLGKSVFRQNEGISQIVREYDIWNLESGIRNRFLKPPAPLRDKPP